MVACTFLVVEVIFHDLIHAFDDCRTENLNWTNCVHHVCSEIRVNRLSSDCHFKRELLRGILKIPDTNQNASKEEF
ncbi:putative peptidase M76, ATP23 [Medicago truncatula]|uniref:Mitochondrial inner membrane protease ATP23 n=1 Tax=Medicago truncatula TaxID=3880 RepID=A0A396GH33_MEDTR|nr:putative peptidase M76, ATP23 [Medicago truncatula]